MFILNKESLSLNDTNITNKENCDSKLIHLNFTNLKLANVFNNLVIILIEFTALAILLGLFTVL